MTDYPEDWNEESVKLLQILMSKEQFLTKNAKAQISSVVPQVLFCFIFIFLFLFIFSLFYY